MRRFLLTFFIGLTLSLLQACGGGDGGSSFSGSNINYSGATTEAEIDSANSEDLGTAAASASRQAIVTETVEDVSEALRPAPGAEDKLLDISPTIAQWIIDSQNVAAKYTDLSDDLCQAGGRAEAETNDAGTSGVVTVSSCGISDGNGSVIVISGSISFTATLSGGALDTVSMTFNVTASYAGETAGINLTISCVDMTGIASCSASSDFVGLDNRIYRVVDITASGSASSGYYVDATVYDPAHGSVSLTTSVPLLFDCASGVPSAGTVVITGTNSSSATVSFDSCDQFTVTVNGLGETFYW